MKPNLSDQMIAFFDHEERNHVKPVANEGVFEVYLHVGVSCVSWDICPISATTTQAQRWTMLLVSLHCASKTVLSSLLS